MEAGAGDLGPHRTQHPGPEIACFNFVNSLRGGRTMPRTSLDQKKVAASKERTVGC